MEVVHIKCYLSWNWASFLELLPYVENKYFRLFSVLDTELLTWICYEVQIEFDFCHVWPS